MFHGKTGWHSKKIYTVAIFIYFPYLFLISLYFCPSFPTAAQPSGLAWHISIQNARILLSKTGCSIPWLEHESNVARTCCVMAACPWRQHGGGDRWFLELSWGIWTWAKLKQKTFNSQITPIEDHSILNWHWSTSWEKLNPHHHIIKTTRDSCDSWDRIRSPMHLRLIVNYLRSTSLCWLCSKKRREDNIKWEFTPIPSKIAHCQYDQNLLFFFFRGKV